METLILRLAFVRILPTIQEDMQARAQGVQRRDAHIQLDAIHIRVVDIGKISSRRYDLIPFPVYFTSIPKNFDGTTGIVGAHSSIMGYLHNNCAHTVLQKLFSGSTVSIRNDHMKHTTWSLQD